MLTIFFSTFLRYKKNLKAFYIVHPTFWTKVSHWNIQNCYVYIFTEFLFWIDDDLVVHNIHGASHQSQGTLTSRCRAFILRHFQGSIRDTRIHHRVRYDGKWGELFNTVVTHLVNLSRKWQHWDRILLLEGINCVALL